MSSLVSVAMEKASQSNVGVCEAEDKPDVFDEDAQHDCDDINPFDFIACSPLGW